MPDRERTDTGYQEDDLIEQPAVELFNALGWEIYNAYQEFDREGDSPLLRETKGEKNTKKSAHIEFYDFSRKGMVNNHGHIVQHIL